MRVSTPRLLLHLEGLVVLVGACVLYAYLGFSWTRFGVFVLAPDVAMLALLVNARMGTACYNAVHTYIGPALLFALFAGLHRPELNWIVLVWTAHIGLDRLVGYGFKYPDNLKQTHLQRA